jgi:hypothetical protein
MTHPPPRRLWMVCVLCGAGVIAFAVWFGGVIPAETCSGALPAGVSSLLAYQLARTPADIERVFGPAGDPCRAGMIAAMDRANTVDLIGFIATYSAFLVFFFLALRRAGGGPAARLGLFAVFAAAIFDVLETATQLHITAQLPGTATSLALLAIGSRGKYLALAVACFCAGLALFARATLLGRIASGACIAGGVAVLVGLAAAPVRGALTAGNALAWLAMLLYAALASVGTRSTSQAALR